MDELAGTTKTAVTVAITEAEPVVGPYRRVLDHTASWPIPAHVTVLYPFITPDRVTVDDIDATQASLATVPAFTCTFSHIAWFRQDVMWLAPDSDAPFRALTESMVRRFPDCLPYRGVHPEPTPHLTVGSTQLADHVSLQRAAAELQTKLPIRARIDRVSLMAGSDVPGSWRTVREFTLPAL